MFPFLFVQIAYTRSGKADRIVIGAAAPNSHANGITELRYQNFNEDPLGVVRLWFTPFPEKPIYNYDI